MNIKKRLSKLKQLMQKINVNGALRLLTNNMSNGILPLLNETLQNLSLKHPKVQKACHGIVTRKQIVTRNQLDYL